MKEKIYFRRVDEPTPNGGVYSIAYYRDKKMIPCTEDKAELIEIVEFDKDDYPFSAHTDSLLYRHLKNKARP